MFGLRLILILAVVGGLIAFIGDKLGSKIGKKKLSVCGYNRRCQGNFYVVQFNHFCKNEPPGCREVSDLCT